MDTIEHWHTVKNASELASPALLLYPDRIMSNIDLMLDIAGGAERLWPHIKTHKNAEIIRMQQEKGINKFKCATLKEAQLLGQCEAEDVLLALQPTGPMIEDFFELMAKFEKTRFSTLIDNVASLKALSTRAKEKESRIRVWLDLDVGMHRTGIDTGQAAIDLYRQMHENPWIEVMGLHAYDGHIHDPDPEVRKGKCHEAIKPVLKIKKELKHLDIKVNSIIAGGSPTFGIHAENQDLELSPGTTLLWDAGYANKYKDLPFSVAATLMTRVISKPTDHIICTDLGHKSVASEMPMPRVLFPGQPGLKQIGHSEEHLILACERSGDFKIGEELYAIPMHICPTVSKYARAHIVRDHTSKTRWLIQARDHEL